MKIHLLTILLIAFAAGCFTVGYTFPTIALMVVSSVFCFSAVVYGYWFLYKWVNSYFGE